MQRLAGMTLPQTYRDLIALAREAFAMYSNLMEIVAEREGFELGAR